MLYSYYVGNNHHSPVVVFTTLRLEALIFYLKQAHLHLSAPFFYKQSMVVENQK